MQIKSVKPSTNSYTNAIRRPEKYSNMGNRTFKIRGSSFVNRDLLSKRQYIKILAQPRPSRRISYLSNILKSYKRRTLPKITPRLLSLALPPKWKILNNWQYYQTILPSYRFERMVEFLLKNDIRFKVPDNCLCKKRPRIKKSIEMEFIRTVIKCTMFVSCILCSINKIDLQVFSESESKSGMSPQRVSTPTSVSTTKTDRFTSSSNNSVKENNNDAKKMQEELVSKEKFEDKSDLGKTRWPSKQKPSKTPKESTISNISKRVIDDDERQIVETYAQTTIIENVSKFTSTTKTDTCHILDCERNDRLLTEIRKFYKKRADLHNEHVFDDVLLPRITLNEIMKYAELVLANQIMAVTPTRHLQNAFQMKIIEWVQEILSIDAWDDCMKCDIKLLSYELARYITEEKKPPKVQRVENDKKEMKESKFITDQRGYGWDQPGGYINTLKIRTSKIRGIDLNVQHFLDITPHKPGTVCCASLKVWSAWIKDVAENAKLWCIWINQIIANMSYLSAIMRGEVYDKDGNQLILMKCDWKQFISNLDDDVDAWRQYNNHIQSLTDQLTTAFHGKRITCCKCCKDENLHISDNSIKHLYRRLFDAMETTRNWRHWLQEMVNEAKQLTCISKERCLCHIPVIEIFPVRTSKNKEPNICNHIDGCPLVPYKEIFVEKDPSIYSIEHWITSDFY
ncbi:uncharacterized protein LOC123297799 [Chrysoperla carnea]|uniref:uncharacterized protein LOC123297799 n=1 Tax=Chrysoperla carnea TaxID=189513 RepID=UPI001D0802F3|nr:uncharacterized protein LOC123297799 [Chrysoperla carnea]